MARKFLIAVFLLMGTSSAHAARWIVYTATQTIDCTGKVNGGKLVTAGADAYCADDIGQSTSTTDSFPYGLQTSTINITSLSSGVLQVNSSGNVITSAVSLSTQVTGSLPAASVAAGSLGSSVIASSVAISGVTAGTYGSATQVSSVTVGADGRLTGAANVTISLTNSNLQSGTYTNVTVPAANVATGSLGSSVIASSVAISGVTSGTYGSGTQVSSVTVGADGRITGAANVTISLTNSNLQSGTYSNVTVPAANVAAGSLGSSVIASSIAVNAVQDASIVAVSASKLTGTGTLPNAAVDGSSITKQGNTFNGTSQLVQMNGSTQLPAVSGVNLTNLNATNLASGTVPNARLDSSSVTLQANTFNGASQLIQLNSSAQIPILPLLGTNTNGTPCAGCVGESTDSVKSNVSVGASAAYFDMDQLQLTAGHWRVSFVVYILRNGSTFTDYDLFCGIGTSSGNSPTGTVTGSNVQEHAYGAALLTFTADSFTIPAWQVNISGTTTYYLKGYVATYSGGPPKYYSRFTAIRTD